VSLVNEGRQIFTLHSSETFLMIREWLVMIYVGGVA